VLRLLRAALPNAIPLCSLVEANVLRPLLEGKPLPLLMSARLGSRPTLSLTEAVTAITPREATEDTEETVSLLERSVLSPPPGPATDESKDGEERKLAL
jgi:hypothetical protein